MVPVSRSRAFANVEGAGQRRKHHGDRRQAHPDSGAGRFAPRIFHRPQIAACRSQSASAAATSVVRRALPLRRRCVVVEAWLP